MKYMYVVYIQVCSYKLAVTIFFHTFGEYGVKFVANAELCKQFAQICWKQNY